MKITSASYLSTCHIIIHNEFGIAIREVHLFRKPLSAYFILDTLMGTGGTILNPDKARKIIKAQKLYKQHIDYDICVFLQKAQLKN